MKAIIIILSVQFFLFYTLQAQSLREMVITEMESDDASVLRLEGEDPSASDYMNMELGFNRSNQGWLRMRTFNDLGFFTNDQRRMTINANGVVDVSNQLVVGSLEGTGMSTVAVNQDGLLVRQPHPVQRMVYGPGSFYATALVPQFESEIYFDGRIPIMYCNSINPNSAFLIPEIALSKYKILAVQFHFTDAVGSENFRFRVSKYDEGYFEEIIESQTPNVASSVANIFNVRIATLNEDVIIDQSAQEYARIRIDFPGLDEDDELDMRVYKVVMIYQEVD